MKIAVIDYNAGNIQSVLFALERLGANAVLTNSDEVIQSADKVIFPGVGDASFAMKALKKSGLDGVIPELKQPVLGICLGMQLLCAHSEEGNTECLGVFPVKVKRFPNETEVKIPHVGWNSITLLSDQIYNQVRSEELVYFVHSYYSPLSAFTSAVCNYGMDFSASLVKGNFHAVQFHPEKSGAVGERILKQFLSL